MEYGITETPDIHVPWRGMCPQFLSPMYHKDKRLSSPCAVRVETNSDWQMGRGHAVNSHTGQDDIKMSFTGQLTKEGSPHACTGSRVTFTT